MSADTDLFKAVSATKWLAAPGQEALHGHVSRLLTVEDHADEQGRRGASGKLG